MNINVRCMQKDDWDAVVAIFKEGIDLRTATFHSEVPTYEAWDQSHVKTCRFVAEVDGGVVGWIALTPFSGRCVYSGVAEVSIYIKASHRGKHVGETLLDTLIIESEKEGFWTLQSGIFEINTASINLHTKFGFRMVGYRERIGKDLNGVWQNTVLMERRSQVAGL